MPVSFIDLAQNCAPVIAVERLAGIVSLESRFEPLTIRINTGPPLPEQPTSKAEAIEIAMSLVAEGHDIQLGRGGIDRKELRKLNLSISDVFDPCLNLQATATLLDGYYRLAISRGVDEMHAEQIMMQSWYGRGDPSIGEMVRYDDRVREEIERLGKTLVPLTIGERGQGRGVGEGSATDTSVAEVIDNPSADQRPSVPSWDVFRSRKRSSVLVFQNDHMEQSE